MNYICPFAICPFCNTNMSVFPPIVDGVIQYRCDDKKCNLFPYTRYCFEMYNDNGNITFSSIMIDYDNKLLSLTCSNAAIILEELVFTRAYDGQNNRQWMVQDLIVKVNEPVDFDLKYPIQSAQKIIDRLLKLKAFS